MKSKKSFFTEWLEKLQQESWQLELLISGLALYGIYASDTILTSIEYYLAVNNNPDYNFLISILIDLLWVSRTIFLINLLIHIIIRGFWIGAIGLRYVSGDINYDRLNYSERFTNFYKKTTGSFDQYIEKLENFSSVLFSFTFLLFFLLFSFFCFNLIIITASTLLGKIPFLETKPGEPGIVALIVFVYYFLGFLVLIDFVTNSAFKKISDKTVSGVYLWIYRFYSIVSLSFLYRPILLNFLDNKFTKRLLYLSGPYIILLMLLYGFKVERHEYLPSFDNQRQFYPAISENMVNYIYYDDLRNEHVESLGQLGRRKRKEKIVNISLSQYEVDKHELKIFLEYSTYDTKRLLDTDKPISGYRKEGLRHRFQFDNNVKDDMYQSIINRELEEVKLSSRISTSDSINNIFVAKYGDYEGNLAELRDRIDENYDVEKYNYMTQKSTDNKDAFINLHTLSLNNIPVTEKLECKYYIHPNMLEKGLLCYIDIDSLPYGGHILTFNRGNYNLNLPFRKIKQNQ